MAGNRVQRKLAAILAADVVGYSGLMQADEAGTMARLRALRADVFDPAVTAHGGRIVKTMGDGFLVEFPSAVDAVHQAVAVQRQLAEAGAGGIALRIGINVGDVVVDDDDLYGDGVNIAARLEGLAAPGGICISGTVYDQLGGRLDIRCDDLGPQEVKNIAGTVRAYAVRLGDGPAAAVAPAAAPPLPDKPSIAVLPFDNMSGDPAQEYVADGVVEALTAALSRIRSFFVIARNSAFTFKKRAVNVTEIGRELGVAYLLEGSVQRAGDRLRITVQLIETAGGAHIWAERYDGSLDDLFDFQDRITEQVAGQLQPSIRLAEIERARLKRPADQGAYDLAMRAMPHVWALEKEESERALELLGQALAIDPDYPLALSLAGWCHAQASVYNWTDSAADSQATAFEMAERAAELGGDDPTILAVLGSVHTLTRNFGTARILLERAVTLDPNAAWAWQRLGWLENYADRQEKAIELYNKALRLSPLDPASFNNYVGIAAASEAMERYGDAEEMYLKALQIRPHATWIYRNLAAVLCGAGKMAEARKAFAIVQRDFPDLTISRFREAMVFSEPVLDLMSENLRKLGLPE